MDTSSPIHRLEEAIARHFLAEKKSGLALIVLSIMALSLAAILLSTRIGKFELGFVFPTASIAFMHFFLGAKLFYQSKHQLQILKNGLKKSPQKAIGMELARVEKAMLKLDKSKKILMLLFLLGFAMVIGGAFCNLGDFTLGTGIGLTAQSGLTLVNEVISSYGAGLYQYELKVFMKRQSSL